MKYLLDTCLISEMVKPKPSAAVVRWLEERDEQTLFLSVLTMGELHKGIGKLPESAKREALQAWVNHDLVQRFEGRILEIDMEIAVVWGGMQGTAERNGVKLPVMDSLIAATAEVHNLSVVTRNAKDMERCGANVCNPWEE